MTDISSEYRALLAREMRGSVDTESAMHRIQTKYGLDYWQQWSLKYRQPKKLAGELIARVHAAYVSTVEQSVRRDVEYLKTEIARGRADAGIKSLMAEAESLLAKIQEARAVK